MNKLSLAMTVLELNLDEWEPIRDKENFIIRDRKTKQNIAIGKSLKIAILKARDLEMGKLNKKR